MGRRQPLAEQLAQEILTIAKRSDTEEDLRIGVEKALDPVLKALDITTHPRYEKATSTSFYDAIHGRLILEYERPGKLKTKRGLEETIEQLVKYLDAEASSYGEKQKEAALKRMVGVSLDGFQILFVRYTGTKARAKVPFPKRKPSAQLALLPEAILPGGFDLDGPNPVNAQTISLFLTYIRALRRYPLTPEELTREFGPDADTARQAVNTFYQTLLASKNPKVDTFFKEWDRIFGIVYGQDISKAEKDAAQLAKRYGVDMRVELKPLLFALHTYYALLMKLLVAELLSLQPESYVPSFVTQLAGLTDAELQSQLSHLEDGGHFQAFRIQNFLEGDFFGWYLADWNEDISATIRRMALRLSDFEPAAAEIDPEATRDLLKKLYQYLVPKKLRHDLGEYYTPDWLAERLLNQVGYDGNPDLRLLDPACGSGTFLALAIKRVREYADEKLLEYEDVAEKVLKNVVGFDLNPIAVIAARTTYLLALGNLRRGVSPITIPVYMCDSVLTPTEYADLFGEGHKIHTTVGDFFVPKEVVAKGALDSLATLIEDCVRDYSTDEFIERVRRVVDIQENGTETALRDLFEKVKGLEEEDRNRIWARILKNAFAPIFQEPFDYVVGNPPWVRWGDLSDEYRQATRNLWEDYGLFSLKGFEARLGAGEKDFSMLFTYACTANYLRPGHKLGFLITQEVFKSKGAGEGFRSFRLGRDGEPLGVLQVEDFVALRPFEGAGNKTAMIVVQKGERTKYPLPYVLWRRKKGRRVTPDMSLSEVLDATHRKKLAAKPVGQSDVAAWQTGTTRMLRVLENVMGSPAYRARRGAGTDPYGVYWMRVLQLLSEGTVLIRNIHDAGKTTIRELQTTIEPDFIYPGLRGADIQRWRARPRAHLLVVQDPDTRLAYDEKWLKLNYPKTYAYLKVFEDALTSRRSRVVQQLMKRSAFYCMYGVGKYTLAPSKVVWQRMGRELKAAVTTSLRDKILGRRPVIPADTVSFIQVKDELEAHFICGLLNSAPLGFAVRSFSAPGRGFGAPSILKQLAIPQYDPLDSVHREFSALSQRAHELASEGDKEALTEVEEEIDRKAGELWGITKSELKEIKRSLEELS